MREIIKCIPYYYKYSISYITCLYFKIYGLQFYACKMKTATGKFISISNLIYVCMDENILFKCPLDEFFKETIVFSKTGCYNIIPTRRK